MNSDPYDSAAWRTFGMMDADESAIFDKAMRHDPELKSAYREMDCLSAAIAATSATPIELKAGQLEHLQIRLGLHPGKMKRTSFWLGISGWATAAVLALILILDRTGILGGKNTHSGPGQATHAPAIHGASLEDTSKGPAIANAANSSRGLDGKNRVETKRLVQEIEVLRENLEKFQHRDRVLFEAVPGMALPIVMTMNPPGVALDESPALVKGEGHSPITSMLGDALTVMTGAASDPEMESEAEPADESTSLPEYPMAIPIYDAARDSGSLVVSNLPPAGADEAYNLWVTTEVGGRPVYVGSLPESSASGADTFDFSLGSTMILPSGFMLTRDPLDKPALPNESNTILQGPPIPSR